MRLLIPLLTSVLQGAPIWAGREPRVVSAHNDAKKEGAGTNWIGGQGQPFGLLVLLQEASLRGCQSAAIILHVCAYRIIIRVPADYRFISQKDL
jgi:hypothetical protein